LSLIQARALLRDYVCAVAIALREAGATEVEQTVAEGSYLEARLRFRCASTWAPTPSGAPPVQDTAPTLGSGSAALEPYIEPHAEPHAGADSGGGGGGGGELGTSAALTRPLADEQTTDQQCATLEWAEDSGWSLTHCSFALDPSAWRFLCTALVPSPGQVVAFARDTVINAGTASRLPARFRHRSQPVQMVIDQLGEHATDPVRSPRPRPCGAGRERRCVSPAIGRVDQAPAGRSKRRRDLDQGGRADVVAGSPAGMSRPALSASP
jgi:hypothetical protein